MRSGLDFSWHEPSIPAVKAGGYSFVIRCLSYDHTGKNLTHAEAACYSANHIDIVSNWEWGTHDALSGYALGRQHAGAANAQHHACGGPAGAPIYFSVDFDVTPQQQAAVNNYLRGAASVIGN
jgi:glycoside hydrolase-like protein